MADRDGNHARGRDAVNPSRLFDAEPTPAPIRAGGTAAAIACAAIALAAWVACIALLRTYPTHDDFFRLHLVRFGLLDPHLTIWMTYWPPLPPLLTWLALGLGEAEPLLWRATVANALLIAGAIAIWAWDGAKRPSDLDGGAWSAALLLSVPVVLRSTASVLSEPAFLAGLVVAWLAVRPARGESSLCRRAMLFTLGGFIACASRYDAWPVIALWGFAVAWRTWDGCRERRTAWWAAWAASALVIAAFPLFWFWINHVVTGNWTTPFGSARAWANEMIAEERAALAFRATLVASPLLVVAAVAGSAPLVRGKRWIDLAIIAVPCVPFAMILLRDLVGSIWPERFALGVLLSCAILGGRLLARLSELASAWRGLAAAMLVAAICVSFARAIVQQPDADTRQFFTPTHLAALEKLPTDKRILVFNHIATFDELYLLAPLAPGNVLLSEKWNADPWATREDAERFDPNLILFDDPQRPECLGIVPRNPVPIAKDWYLAEFDFVDAPHADEALP